MQERLSRGFGPFAMLWQDVFPENSIGHAGQGLRDEIWRHAALIKKARQSQPMSVR